MDLSNRTILITGGTGLFGSKFVAHLLQNHPGIKRIIIFSRDEQKQFEMAQHYSGEQLGKLQFLLGDIRDKERVYRAFEGVDYVIHAAALKQVPAAEHNPMEVIKTNVLGAENIINASLDCGVKRVVALSTDKAAAPISLYGATKLCSDKLFSAANNMRGDRDLIFSVVRYGNVIGSRGSVIPFFLQKRNEGVLPVTHPEMTRFNISSEQGIKLVMHALEHAWGGEVFVPKIPSYRILDVAEAIGPNCEVKITGVRPGEKLHEEMITETDSLSTIEFPDYYAIIPSTPMWDPEALIKKFNGKMVAEGFRYNSASNEEWLSVEDIRHQIRKHVDPNFSW